MSAQFNRIILASSSAYRRELLGRLGVAFACKSPDVDESPRPDEAPGDLAARLALAKAEVVAATARSPALIIGSDQVASCNASVFGKPGNRERAREQLRRASGREVEFHTAVAVAVVAAGDARVETGVDLTRVRFRSLTDAEIDRYVDRERPYDCAGGFKAEGLGIALFETIESQDPTALIGLPLIMVAKFLRTFGYELP